MSAISWLKLLCKTLSFPNLLLIVLLPAAAQSQSPLFPIANTLPIGAVSTPAVGDFNGDGQPDLIYSPPPIPTGSTQFATLTVLLNQGAASNPTPVVTSSLTCTSVTSLVVADMNKDQRQDVVLTCTEGFVAVLFGNGDGTFQKPTYYAVPTTSVLIPPTDLNGDGYPDVALSNATSVIVLLNQANNSPGTLSAAATYPAAGIQFSLIGAGDFNGDGKPDLLGVANEVNQSDGFQFITYLSNGDGTFQAFRHRLMRASLLTVFLAVSLLSFAGCSSSSPKTPMAANPGTPNGVQSIVISVADTVNNISHSLNFQLAVQ